MDRLKRPDVWSNIFFIGAGIPVLFCGEYRLPLLMGLALIALGTGSGIDHYRSPDTDWTLDRTGMYLTYSLLAYLAVGGASIWAGILIWTVAVVLATSQRLVRIVPSFSVLAVLGVIIITGAVLQATVGEALVSTALVIAMFAFRYLDKQVNGSALHAAWHFMASIITIGIYGIVA